MDLNNKLKESSSTGGRLIAVAYFEVTSKFILENNKLETSGDRSSRGAGLMLDGVSRSQIFAETVVVSSNWIIADALKFSAGAGMYLTNCNDVIFRANSVSIFYSF